MAEEAVKVTSLLVQGIWWELFVGIRTNALRLFRWYLYLHVFIYSLIWCTHRRESTSCPNLGVYSMCIYIYNYICIYKSISEWFLPCQFLTCWSLEERAAATILTECWSSPWEKRDWVYSALFDFWSQSVQWSGGSLGRVLWMRWM